MSTRGEQKPDWTRPATTTNTTKANARNPNNLNSKERIELIGNIIKLATRAFITKKSVAAVLLSVVGLKEASHRL